MWIFKEVAFAALRVSRPCKGSDSKFVLKMRSSVFLPISFDLHILPSLKKALESCWKISVWAIILALFCSDLAHHTSEVRKRFFFHSLYFHWQKISNTTFEFVPLLYLACLSPVCFFNLWKSLILCFSTKHLLSCLWNCSSKLSKTPTIQKRVHSWVHKDHSVSKIPHGRPIVP